MSHIMVITGTRKGIGKALGEYYLNKGFSVIGCSRKEGSIADPNYYHYQLDVADEKAVISMVKDVAKRFGRIDVLINNAGMASMNHILLTSVDAVKKIYNTNLIGTFLFLREVGKVMAKQKRGRIINFTSVATPLRLAGEAIYASSKAAIVNLTEIAAKELADFNVTVNAVGPTPINTDLIKTVPKEKIEVLMEQQAIKRFGEFGDVTNVIDFFIDEKSDFITGQIIYLGGVHH
ncbi:MAG: SDR family NAD(P)-dependent oxidoreductase [bacterium]